MVDHVQYIIIPIADPARALSFYTDLLHMEVVEDEQRGRARWIVVQPPHGLVKLLLFPSGPEHRPRRTPLYLHTTDVRAAYERLQEASVTCEPPIERKGRSVVILRDPDRNPLVLTNG
jgi:catechol 2,3-dioxygenase-like lactoylglutathione lyase family enzyme